MTVSLHVVAKFDSGFVLILETITAEKTVATLKEEIYSEVINDIDIESLADSYKSIKDYSKKGRVCSVDVMSYDEIQFMNRAHKISNPARPISKIEYNDIRQLGKPLKEGSAGFVIKTPPQSSQRDLNLGVNCYASNGSFYQKDVSISDPQSWVI